VERDGSVGKGVYRLRRGGGDMSTNQRVIIDVLSFDIRELWTSEVLFLEL